MAKPAVYSEAEVRRWLGWLARGMQKRGQSVFLIEDLQPDWLLKGWQIRSYQFLSHSIQALAMLLLMSCTSTALLPGGKANILQLAACYLCPAILGVIAAWGLQDRRRWWSVILSYAGASVCFVLVPVGLVFSGTLDDSERVTILVPGVILFLLIASRGRRVMGSDIRSGGIPWSWEGFRKGILMKELPRVSELLFSEEKMRRLGASRYGGSFSRLVNRMRPAFPVVDACGVWFLRVYIVAAWGAFLVQREPEFAIYVFTMHMVFGTRGAQARKLTERLKTTPNEGIHRALRLVITILVSSFVGAGVVKLLGLRFHPALLDYAPFLIVIAGIGVAGLRGLDVIAHYVLRWLLCLNGYIPRKYAEFLDYAANELGFLQKVGGSYIFMHRYLLEYFAGQGEETAGDVGVQVAAQPAS